MRAPRVDEWLRAADARLGTRFPPPHTASYTPSSPPQMRRLQEEQLRAYESELRRDCGREEYVSRLERECEELRALVEQAHSTPANGAKNDAMNGTTGGAPAVSVAPAADPPVADPSAAKPSPASGSARIQLRLSGKAACGCA